MRESRCPNDSSTSNDRDGKAPPQIVTKRRGTVDNGHLLSDICRYLDGSPNRYRSTTSSSRENVELGLEIEINESLKRVLTTPNSGSDDLLDVTIIRPSESDVTHETTVALNKEEVRDFISLVEQHQQNKLKCGKLKSNDRKDKKRNDDFPDHIPSSKQKEVKNEERGEKPGTPCVCQHCGIMGVLVQTNKAEINQKRDDKDDRRKHRPRSPDDPRGSRDGRSTPRNKSQDQIQLLREINTRIKDLEKRITLQEENAVPRDYLKHILHKLITQYKEEKPQSNLKNAGTQYFVESREKYPSQHHQKKDEKEKHYQVHTLLHTTAPLGFQRSDIGEPSTTSHNTSNDPALSSGSKKQPVYFWGEEVVKPGCDLKTKILSLLDEKIGKPSNEPKHVHQSKIPVALPEKLPKSPDREIKVERDDNMLHLSKMQGISPCNIDDIVQRSKIPELIKPPVDKTVPKNKGTKTPTSACSVVPESLRPEAKPKPIPQPRPVKVNTQNLHYSFDAKRMFDDSVFRRNIEAQKERSANDKSNVPNQNNRNPDFGQKPSMEFILQQLRQRAGANPTGNQKNPYEQLASTIIKEKMTCGFRTKTAQEQGSNTFSIPVDITYVNPKITQWSEESTASEDRYMKFFRPNERKESLPVEAKESLIYKLEFLKNLAKHRSADESKVLNKIWTQAKKTAKSKNDAVFIKIPFKSVNAVEPRNNVIEMQLTLEQLETVVKSVKATESNSKMVKYKSSSEIDIGQRRHEQIRKANMEVLNKRRNLSAKGPRYKR